MTERDGVESMYTLTLHVRVDGALGVASEVFTFTGADHAAAWAAWEEFNTSHEWEVLRSEGSEGPKGSES